VVDFGVFAGDQYQNVAEQIETCALVRRCGKYGDGLVLRMSGDWRGLPHALPNDENKRNDAKNYD
jgi:hypothetical protein